MPSHTAQKHSVSASTPTRMHCCRDNVSSEGTSCPVGGDYYQEALLHLVVVPLVRLPRGASSTAPMPSGTELALRSRRDC